MSVEEAECINPETLERILGLIPDTPCAELYVNTYGFNLSDINRQAKEVYDWMEFREKEYPFVPINVPFQIKDPKNEYVLELYTRRYDTRAEKWCEGKKWIRFDKAKWQIGDGIHPTVFMELTSEMSIRCMGYTLNTLPEFISKMKDIVPTCVNISL